MIKYPITGWFPLSDYFHDLKNDKAYLKPVPSVAATYAQILAFEALNKTLLERAQHFFRLWHDPSKIFSKLADPAVLGIIEGDLEMQLSKQAQVLAVKKLKEEEMEREGREREVTEPLGKLDVEE